MKRKYTLLIYNHQCRATVANTIFRSSSLTFYIRGRQPTASGPDAAHLGTIPGPQPLLSSGPRHFSFFNDRYAAKNRRNNSQLLAKTFFCGLRHRFVRKRPDLLAKPLPFLVFAINSAEKRPQFLAKAFLVWSAGMVAARWNLIRTKCGPLL